MNTDQIARLVVQCEDKPGIVSAVSTFLYDQGANITMLDQYSTDPGGGKFFLRLEFQLATIQQRIETIKRAFQQAVAGPFNMGWQLNPLTQKKRAVIMVSKHDHALLELLWQVERGALEMQVDKIISNHPDLSTKAAQFGIPFVHVPVSANSKSQAEQTIGAAIGDNTQLIILARYMQILSKSFIERYPQRIINIHHSFLPAFVGANPYQQAHDRGVKIIGATAHYVTEELDAGPIIAQDVEPISHRDSVDDLKQTGRNIERNVLSKAVKWHLEDRVFVHDNATLIFN